MAPGRLATLLCFAAASLAAMPSADAHTVSRSHSRWTIEGPAVRVSVTIPLVEVRRLTPAPAAPANGRALADDPALSASVTEYVLGGVELVDRDANCRRTSEPTLRPSADAITFGWRLLCDRPPRPAVTSRIFFDTAPSHLHFVTIRTGDRRDAGVLTASQRSIDLSRGHAQASGFARFVTSGVRHVAIGWDHVLFILGLLLLGGGLRTIAAIVTGFTVGHSVTLALAITGTLTVNAAAVEVLVGLSIVHVALHAFFSWANPRGKRQIIAVAATLFVVVALTKVANSSSLPWLAIGGMAMFMVAHLLQAAHREPRASSRTALAMVFGLVHGLALASVLAAPIGGDIGLPLLGFNVGVEIGQLVVVLGGLAVLGGVAKTLGPSWRVRVTAAAASGVLAAGVFWTFSRLAA